jgi:oligopeptidase A
MGSRSSDNPLLQTSGMPRFDEIQAEHVAPAVGQVLESTEERLQQLESALQPTREGLLQPLELLDRPFEYAWSPL